MPFIASTRGNYGAQGRFGARGRFIASGGTETTSGSYKIHTFNSNGSFTVTSSPSGSLVDYLMVGAGGGGGATGSGNCGHGGGGAGGLVYRTGETISAGTYSIVIGTGGIGCTGDSSGVKPNATNGNNTTLMVLLL